MRARACAGWEAARNACHMNNREKKEWEEGEKKETGAEEGCDSADCAESNALHDC